MWIKILDQIRVIIARPEVQLAIATSVASLITGFKDKIKSWFSSAKRRVIKKKKK